jgi:hypothetical protein
VISGGGVGALRADNDNRATIQGNLNVSDAQGGVAGVGRISPGGSSNANASSAGNLVGQLRVTGNLNLGGGLGGGSSEVERLALQLNGATSSLVQMGWNLSGSVQDFIASLATPNTAQANIMNGVAGNLSNHDYLTVDGTLTVNSGGRVSVSLYSGFAPAAGQIFNLMDWGSILNNGFTVNNNYTGAGDFAGSGFDLDLPDISGFSNGSLSWNTALFSNYGVIVVVPEPSRVMLLMLGLLALALRRRRD